MEWRKEAIELLVRRSFYEGVEAGINEVTPTSRPTPHELWMRSDMRKTFNYFFEP